VIHEINEVNWSRTQATKKLSQIDNLVSIVTTSRGVIANKQAKKLNVGGEAFVRFGKRGAHVKIGRKPIKIDGLRRC
jgi:ribosomal protein S8